MKPTEQLVYDLLTQQGWRVIRNGWPDFLCVRDGMVKAVEVKGAFTTIPKHQRENRAALQMAGLTVEIIEALPFSEFSTPCQGCGSGQTYYRQDANERVCRACGTVSQVKK